MSVARCCCGGPCDSIIAGLEATADTASFNEEFTTLDSEWTQVNASLQTIGGTCSIDNQTDTSGSSISTSLRRWQEVHDRTDVSIELDMHLQNPNGRISNEFVFNLFTPDSTLSAPSFRGLQYKLAIAYDGSSNASMTESFSVFDTGGATTVWSNSVLSGGSTATYNRTALLELSRTATTDTEWDYDLILDSVSKATGTVDMIREGTSSDPQPACVMRTFIDYNSVFGYDSGTYPTNSNKPYVDNYDLVMS